MTRLEILYNEMLKRKLISSKKDFSKKFGFAYANLSRYLSGTLKTTIDSDNYRNFADAGININWLLTGEGNMFLDKTENNLSNIHVKIPLLAQRVSCGPGQSWEQGDNIECYIEPLALIPALKGKDIYAFKAKGISMLGVGIQNGDILFFDAYKGQVVSDGIYVFALFGDVFCKLLRFEKIEKKVMIYSVPNKELTEAELIRTITIGNDDFHLLGRVLAWMHEDKLFQAF